MRGLIALLTVAAAAASATAHRPALWPSCGRSGDFAAAWAPSGRSVAFAHIGSSGGVSQVFRIDIDGRGLRRISGPGDYAYGPVWAPSGTSIAYTTFDLRAVVRIVVARGDGEAAHVVGSFQGEREPPTTFTTWSPDGARLAYVDSDDNLVAVDAGGGVQRVVARGATQPSWSPAGDRIAYADSKGIVVANSDATDAHALADGALPQWSPDGRFLAYTSRSGVGVHVISSDGTNDRLVDADGLFPSWFPDGRRLVDVTESGRGYGVVHVVDVARRHVVTVSHDASRRFGSDDAAVAVAPAGKDIVYGSVPAVGGSELRLVRPDGRRERRLTYHCAVVDEGRGSRVYGTWLDDIILARNRLRETIVCGAGHDVVIADRRDRVGSGCESVRR